MRYKEYQERIGAYVTAVNAATPSGDKANAEGLLWLIREGRCLALTDVTDKVQKVTDPMPSLLGRCIKRLQTMRGGQHAPCVV